MIETETDAPMLWNVRLSVWRCVFFFFALHSVCIAIGLRLYSIRAHCSSFVAIAVDRLAGGCPLRGFDGLSDVVPPLISTVSVDSILRL